MLYCDVLLSRDVCAATVLFYQSTDKGVGVCVGGLAQNFEVDFFWSFQAKYETKK